MTSLFYSATVAGVLAVSMLQASGAPRVTFSQGAVQATEESLQTNSSGSALQASLTSSSIVRLAGISRTSTRGRPLHLEQGQALLSSSRGFTGRRKIETALGPLAVSLHGTALLSALPGQPLKITVIEGSATVRLAERRSHFTEVRAGSMLMVSGGETSLPTPTEVRLARLQETSGLLAKPFDTLPADREMKKAIARQENELNKKRLLASNLKVKGGRATLGSSGENSPDNSSDTSSSSSASGGSSTSSSGSGSGGTTSSSGGGGAAAGFHCVGCASHATPVGAVSANDPNRIALIRAEAASAPGERAAATVPGGKVSAAISIPNATSRGDLAVAPEDTTISVSNSSDLNALAQAVILASFGENISVNASSFVRQPGVINLDAGTIFERTLSLNQSNFSADVIKARSFNRPGTDALLVRGGGYNASQLIRLYAEGGGALRFSGEVSLSSPNADLAGSIVQVDPGSTVRTSGNVRIFSDDHRYDREGFGTIQSATTKTASPFATRPRY